MKSIKVTQQSYAERYVDLGEKQPIVSIEVFYTQDRGGSAEQGWTGNKTLTFECDEKVFTLDTEQLVKMLRGLGLKVSIQHPKTEQG